LEQQRGEEHGARGALRYRGEIDGLRAVAVLGVLLFHVGGLRGGFVGVDVFLVISGYLITGNIWRARASGAFTLAGFYQRRFVRILPVLIVVVAATLAYAAVALLPVEIARIGWSAAAATLSVSNVYFHATTGYFALAGEAQPLLHTWSLGLEEQFYLAYPLLIAGLARTRWSPRVALLWLGVASFVLGSVQALYHPAAGFYLLPGRIWELALGAWLAAERVSWRSRRWREGASAAGLALVVLAMLVLKSDLPFPTPVALLPCAGAALVLAYGADTSTGALLRARPLRGTGAISYSVYLWHWPLITFYRLRFGVTLHVGEAALLIAVSLGIGAASFYLVERPASRRWREAAPVRVNTLGVVVVVGLAALALGVASNAARVRPVDPGVAALASYVDYERSAAGEAQFRRGVCFATDDAPGYDPARCLAHVPGYPALLVIGDSYAAQYWRAIAGRFPQASVLQATSAGCRPLIDARGEQRCTAMMRRVFADLVATRGVDAVVLAGRWLAKEDAALARTIAFVRAHGVAVTVIGPAVEYDGAVPLLLARSVEQGDARMVDRFRVDATGRERAIRAIAWRAGASYHSIAARECPGERCFLLAAPGVPVHFDGGHVTQPAARYLMRDLAWPR